MFGKNKNNKKTESTRGRAFIVSAVGGVTLLILAVTVFAVASQARSVSSQAEKSVRIIEDLRVVSISRAELSIASRVAALSSDQGEVVSTTLENAEAALDAVEQNFNDQTSDSIRSAFTNYREIAKSQADLILSNTGDRQAAVDAEVATGEAFDALSSALRDEQVAALEGLRADNDLMNLISTIATFVVAFVVPSAALYIFEALRRAPRRARQLEQAYETSSASSLAMASAVSAEATNLREVVKAIPQGAHSEALRRSILRFEHVAALNGSVRSVNNTRVDLGELARSVSRSMGNSAAINTDGITNAVVVGDKEQIALVITELLHNAVTHGAGPVSLEVSSEQTFVRMTVTDQGPGLPDVIEDAIIHDNEYATRVNMMSGEYGFGVLAAREAAEALGGQLRYEREDNETSLIVEIPKSHLAQVS